MASSGAEIASAYVALTVKMPGVGSAVSRALGGSDVQSALASGGKSMGAVLAGAVGGAVAAATSKAIGLVTKSIGDAVKRVDIMNNFPKVMKNLGYSTKDATKSINKMSDGLKGLPTSLDAMSGTVQQLAPLTSGLGEATDLSLALNNALLAGGKSTEYQANAMEQYTQMLAIGKVDMAAWRSLVSAMPGQMDQLSVALLGAGNKSMDLYEAMKSGEVTFDDFNQAVLKLNRDGIGSFASFEKQARDSTDGIGTGWANLETAITRNLANIIQRLKPAIDSFLSGGTAIANALGPAVLSIIDVAAAVWDWSAANRDWLVPVGVFVGLLTAVYKGTKLVQAVTLGYQAAVKGAQIATFLSGGALKTYNVILALTAAKTKIATVAQKAFTYAFKTNPIGVIVTAVTALVAALVYFFTQTETGKKVWAEFTRFLGEAWANISGFFKAAYENVIRPVFEGISAAVQAVGGFFVAIWTGHIKPVFDGIAAVATWVFQHILLPAFDLVKFAFTIMAGLIVGTYEALIKPMLDAFGKGVAWLNENIVQPAIQAIGAAFTWVSENVIAPIVEGIKLYIKGWGIIVQWLYSTVIKPVIAAVGAAFNWVWLNVIKPVVDFIVAYFKLWGQVFSQLWTNQIKPTIDGIANVFRWLWDNVIKPVWDGIFGTIQSVWNKIKTVIDTMVRIVQSDPKKAFEAARDGIKTAWDAIQEIAKKPVRFVVETVFGGLVDAVNGFLPKGMKLPRPALPKGFREGGFTPNVGLNTVAGVVHGREFVTRAESTARIERNHPGLLDHMNRTGTVPGFRKGGLVHPLPGSVITTQWMGYPGHTGMDFAKPQGTPIQAAAAGVVSKQFYHHNYGNMVDLNHGAGFSTRYAHMLSNVAVRLGQSVKAGQVVGYEGSTGNSTGPHLHFETLQNGNPVNPAPFLSGAASVKPAFGIVEGLLDGAISKFTGAFPEGGFFVDAAGSVMKSAVKGAVDWIGEKLSFGVGGGTPLLYDNGGWLQPGLSLVNNKSGRPEPVFTAAEFDRMVAGGGGIAPGTRLVFVLDDGTELGGYVDRHAEQVVNRKLAPVSPGALASAHGRRA